VLLLCASLLLALPVSAETPAAAPATPAAQAPAAQPSEAPAAIDEPGPLFPMEGLESASAPEEPESLGWMLLRTVLVFGLVVLSIYLTLNVGLRRLMGLQGVPMGRPSVVSVVERVALDQRRTLFVLKAADEYLLVGGGEGGLQLLSKLDTESVERIRAERPPANVVPLSPFLQKLLARREAASANSTPQPSSSQPPSA
jgi:flagellar biogenesis protein FliO